MILLKFSIAVRAAYILLNYFEIHFPAIIIIKGKTRCIDRPVKKYKSIL